MPRSRVGRDRSSELSFERTFEQRGVQHHAYPEQHHRGDDERPGQAEHDPEIATEAPGQVEADLEGGDRDHRLHDAADVHRGEAVVPLALAGERGGGDADGGSVDHGLQQAADHDDRHPHRRVR